ncbi:MAG: hypothetical protein JXX28_17165 [Deltaproteobacteria bacterium]|nr:hypothetical protein [Deltaproteobacteria bacterium]
MATPPLPTVVQALQGVALWQHEALASNQKQLEDVDHEVLQFEQAIRNLQEQIAALETFRAELGQQRGLIDDELTQRSYDAIFEALHAQHQALQQRSTLMGAAWGERDAALARLAEQSDVAPLLHEYQQFKTSVEPTLEMLPASYRDVIRAHHQGIVKQLRARVSDILEGVTELKAEALTFDVVYAIDAPEGPAELLMLVLPVSDTVQTRWTEREEDLQSHIAARAIHGLYAACHELGLGGAQAMYGGHQGMLAIEVELRGGDPDAIAGVLERALHNAVSISEELRGAGLRPTVFRVHVDHLLPPEEADMETLEMNHA